MGRNMRGYPPPTDEQLARERQVLELRRAGVSFDVIAEQTGYNDRGAAYKAFKRAMARTLAEPAAELRDLEQDRLDRLMAPVWQKALRGELPAVDRVLRIMERRARLLGLDHADGIAERHVALEEAQGRLLVGFVERLIRRLGHDPNDPAVRELVREELVAIESAEPQVIDHDPSAEAS